jgi:hypothetical protein
MKIGGGNQIIMALHKTSHFDTSYRKLVRTNVLKSTREHK